MPEPVTARPTVVRHASGRPLRLGHLTTVDMSLSLLLDTELRMDVDWGFETFGISAPGPYVDKLPPGVQHVSVDRLTRAWDVRGDLAAAASLGRLLRNLRLDVLHTHNPKTGVLGRVLGRTARIPVVVNTCHGLWASPLDGRKRRTAVLAIEAAAARFSHRELYQNADDLHALRRAVPARRSRLVGNGIDLSRFSADAGDRARVRAELGVGPEQVLVGGVGRLVAEKGVRELASVARALADEATFVWVGPDDAAKSDALSPGALDGLRFLGPWDDMPAYYSALDVFVLPSHREGFSRSAMEAAACGLPMVLSDIRGCREIGADGVHLLLTPVRDSNALGAAVASLVRDPGLRTRLGGAAATRAKEEFDQRTVALQSLSAYVEVAAERRLGWQVGELPR